MELFPNEYQQLGLTKNEKLFVRYAHASKEEFGMMLLKINPAMIKEEYLHAYILKEGITFIKILDINNADVFDPFIEAYREGIYDTTNDVIIGKLKDNLMLLDDKGQLGVRVAYLCVFPEIKKSDIVRNTENVELDTFIDQCCVFADEFGEYKKDFLTCSVNKLMKANKEESQWIQISDDNVNGILQRIAPEYTIVRLAGINTEEASTIAGADERQLVVTKDDVAVRAFRLDTDQINIVNKITKGDQLILACAGSGKSVLLISKCFKAAKMNPEKKFLITCYNRNLQSQYAWFIERAGLKERNVDCRTYDALCRHLLQSNNMSVPTGEDVIQRTRNKAMKALLDGAIKDRYYGIFIDEVQMFETLWYKLCFNLLENKNSEDHIFIICGDKTQEIKTRQKHGRAPWNAGEGYPSYRGGNKNIRIEKNFRNSVIINDYINRFAQNARELVHRHVPSQEYDPDLFLRGKAFREGGEIKIKNAIGNALVEAVEIRKSVSYFHDVIGVPYDEIAITMFNRQFKPMKYYLESAIEKELDKVNIPKTKLYTSDLNWGGRYGDGGVSLITFDSTLGLDYEAVIVCGIKPMGIYDKTKKLVREEVLDDEKADCLKKNISYLYVACTRARDYLHIVLSEKSDNSIYNTLLLKSERK